MTDNIVDPTRFQAFFEKEFRGRRIHALPKKGGTRTWNMPKGSPTWFDASKPWRDKNTNCNFYFSPVRFKPGSKTSQKPDVQSSLWLWLDLDPREGQPLEAERAEMLYLLTVGLPDNIPVPTFVIDSGRGYWGLWKLKYPQVFDGPNGDATRIFEAVERGIANAFGAYGDRSVINSNRIVRLPGTINLKTGKRAEVVEFNADASYTLSDFPSIVVERRPRADTDVEPISTKLLERMLKATPYTGGPNGLDDRRAYKPWLEFAMSVHEACNGDADGLAAFTEWCLADPERGDDDPEKIQAHWDSFDSEAAGGVTRASWTTLLGFFPGNDEMVSDATSAPDAAEDFTGDKVENFEPIGKWDPVKKEYVKLKPDELKEKIKEQRAARKQARRLNAVLSQYTLCTEPVAFIKADSTALVSKATFSARYNPFTARMSIPTRYKDDAAKYVISMPFGMIERVDGLCYRPGDDRRIIDEKANMWVAPPITPLDEEPKFLLDHVLYLIPDPVERKLVLDWLAHCVKKPMTKLMFALLIVDAKGGTGKSWLGSLMRILLGRQNVLILGKDNKVDAKFNSKFLNRAFTFVNEALPNGRTNLVDAFKDAITEDTIWIEKKGVDEFTAENRNNIMALTNHANALKILLTNRRWAVAMGTTDVRYCDDAGEPTPETVAYYEKLFDETPGGPGIGTPEEPGDEARRALNFFLKRDLSSFKGQSLAPHTNAKAEVAEATEGNWSSYLKVAKADKAEPFTRDLFTAQEVLDVLAKQFSSTAGRSNVRTPELGDALIESGCRKIAKQVRLADGKKVRLWTLTPGMKKKYDEMAPAAVAKLYAKLCAADKPGDTTTDFDDDPEPTIAPNADPQNLGLVDLDDMLS